MHMSYRSIQCGIFAAIISHLVSLKIGDGTPGLVVHSVSQYPNVASLGDMNPLPTKHDFSGILGLSLYSSFCSKIWVAR